MIFSSKYIDVLIKNKRRIATMSRLWSDYISVRAFLLALFLRSRCFASLPSCICHNISRILLSLKRFSLVNIKYRSVILSSLSFLLSLRVSVFVVRDIRRDGTRSTQVSFPLRAVSSPSRWYFYVIVPRKSISHPATAWHPWVISPATCLQAHEKSFVIVS